MKGNAGNDRLVGGNGVDTMVGGEGNDSFVYAHSSKATGGDVISDFGAGDIIDLGVVDAKSLTAGDQAFTFIGGAAFSKAAGELRYSGGTSPATSTVTAMPTSVSTSPTATPSRPTTSSSDPTSL